MRWKWIALLSVLIVAFAALPGAAERWNGLKPKASFAWNYVQAALENRSFMFADMKGEAYILIHADSGKMLTGKNEEKRLYPASTTKMLTALIALERGNLQDRITVGDEVRLREPGESTAGLQEGQTLSLRDLLSAMMLPSGNDAARTVARYIAGKERGKDVGVEEAIAYFAGLMNSRAEELGASNSHFVNPHGLHDPKHYSTAKDMALIAQQAMKHETFRDIVGEQEHTVKLSDSSRTYANRNQLLQQDSPYYFASANGIKTGFTDEAGYCLVASASRNGNRLISVVLRSTSQGVWNDTQKLFRYGFQT